MLDLIKSKKTVISYLISKGILISNEFIPIIEDRDNIERLFNLISNGQSFESVNFVLESMSKAKDIQLDNTQLVGKTEDKDKLSADKPLLNKKKDMGGQVAEEGDNKGENKSNFFDGKNALNINVSNINIICDYDLESKKREVEHFVSYFAARYKKLESILKQRTELSSILSISRLKAKKDRDNVAIIGLVLKKQTTKNNNIILTLEDPTGDIKVLVNKTNPNLIKQAEDLVNDEVIGVVGVNGDNILFSNQIVQPDIPLDKEFKKYSEEEYVIFLSDLHFGSKYFLENEFNKFISWIRGETGTDKQRGIAAKVKNIFIVGDVVDGVGIYPNQENDLTCIDIYDQYQLAAEALKKIPKHIRIIIAPGNHDAVRLSEPQPKLSKTYARPLYEMENVINVSNPSYINICSDENFNGFDILIYHGFSFDHYVANVNSIRLGGGYDRADLIMKFLLKRRHLAPAYKSTLFIPEENNDYLIIDKIPDFFITGHIHKTAVNTYRNVTLISGSCWQSKTSFQEKVGHNPEPARVPVVNLKTRKVTVLNFESGE